MKIALVQMDIEWEAKGPNHKKAAKFIKQASEAGADIAVFPEMFDTGFSMDVAKIAEPKGGETAKFLSDSAKKHNINIIAGYAVLDGKKGRNMAFAYGRKGELIAEFTKLHPFTFAGEHERYNPGESAVVFEVEGVTASVFICYDLRFPEVFRAVAADARMIFVLANWPASRIGHWDALLKARAIEDQCYIIGVNRAGTGGNGIHYPGASRVYGPTGDAVSAGGDREELVMAEIDPWEVETIRLKFPFLKDIRSANKLK